MFSVLAEGALQGSVSIIQEEFFFFNRENHHILFTGSLLRCLPELETHSSVLGESWKLDQLSHQHATASQGPHLQEPELRSQSHELNAGIQMQNVGVFNPSLNAHPFQEFLC